MNAIEQAGAYEPIFYHHPDERWVPVHPVAYLAAAKLWLARSRADAARKAPRNWGRCRMPAPVDPPGPLGPPDIGPTVFQQGLPLIERGRISVDAADERADYFDSDAGPRYLGHDEEGGVRDNDCCDRRYPYTESTGQCENFLDVGGWVDTAELGPGSPDAAQYTHPGVERAFDLWSEDERAPSLDAHYVEILDGKDVLSPTVMDTLRARFDVDELRLFLYYGLYPIHEAEGLGGDRADYEGDWVCLAVLASPASEDASTAPPPVAVGYGSRDRLGPQPDRFRIRFRDAFELRLHEGHPKAYVAAGRHHLHSQPGGDPGATEEAVSEALEDAAERAEDALADLESTKDSVVILLKIAAGALIGGLIGAAVGAIAGAIEAASSSPPEIDLSGGPGDGERRPGGGDAVPASAFGTILAPAAIGAGLPEAADATEVRAWRGALDARVVDRDTQPWWRESACLPTPGDALRPAYEGRWGVMCTEDRLDRRSGMPFPDFVCALDRSLLVALSADPDA